MNNDNRNLTSRKLVLKNQEGLERKASSLWDQTGAQPRILLEQKVCRPCCILLCRFHEGHHILHICDRRHSIGPYYFLIFGKAHLLQNIHPVLLQERVLQGSDRKSTRLNSSHR